MSRPNQPHGPQREYNSRDGEPPDQWDAPPDAYRRDDKRAMRRDQPRDEGRGSRAGWDEPERGWDRDRSPSRAPGSSRNRPDDGQRPPSRRESPSRGGNRDAGYGQPPGGDERPRRRNATRPIEDPFDAPPQYNDRRQPSGAGYGSSQDPRAGRDSRGGREGRGDWDERDSRAPRRGSSSAGDRRNASRDHRPLDDWGGDGPQGWDDHGWGDGGWDERDWDGGAWDAKRAEPAPRHGSQAGRGRRGGRSVAVYDDDAWQPSSRRGNRGVAAHSAQAMRDLTAGLAVVAKRPASAGGRFRNLLRPENRVRLISLIMLVVILFCTLGAITPVAYAGFTAKSAVDNLKAAEADLKLLASSPTNVALITDAQNHMQAAHDDLVKLQPFMGLAGPAANLPKVGSKVAGAPRLMPLAIQGTQAAVLGLDALKTLVGGMKNPFGATGGLTSADMDRVISDVDQVVAMYHQLEPQIAALQPSDLSLDPALIPTVAKLQTELPKITPLLSDVQAFVHVLPQLLGVGQPSTYLVLILDSAELRPTGGFIGNFGTLTLNNGRLDPGFAISDITIIDSPTRFDSANVPYAGFTSQNITIPDQYTWLERVFTPAPQYTWSLRDSNLSPDYPTSAQLSMNIYKQEVDSAQKNLVAQDSKLKLYNGPFTGVVTLSLGLFQQALKITGPLDVVVKTNTKTIHETVNANNFVSKIHEYALGSQMTGGDNQVCGNTSCAKVFTSAVVKTFMAKVKANMSQYIGKMGKLFYDSLKTKDVQLYLTPPAAEKMLTNLHADGSIAQPATGDSVFEVDANVGANKDNTVLKYNMSDQITLSQSGTATHDLTWSYTWPNDPNAYDLTFPAQTNDYTYTSYSRIYTPPQAQLISTYNFSDGFLGGGTDTYSFPYDSTSDTARNVFGSYVQAGYNLGQVTTHEASWDVPKVVTHDSTGYHYHLIFQRQAGLFWPLTLSISLPSCAHLSHPVTVTGMTPSSTPSVKNNTVTIKGTLNQDTTVQIDYTC